MKFGIISDIHEDVIALKKAIALCNERGCDQLICLGDICGFELPYYSYEQSRNANECINIVRSEFSVVCPGNHDFQKIGKLSQYMLSENIPANYYALTVEEKQKFVEDRFWKYESDKESFISEDNKNWLLDLSEFRLLKLEDYSIFFSHYLFPDFVGTSTFAATKRSDFDEHLLFVKQNNAKLAFIGHMHIAGCTIVRKKKKFYTNFGNKKLKDKDLLLICPVLARTNCKNGFIIFDTKNKELSIIHLKS